MPEFPGTLKPPRLASAPASPAKGQLYFDTTANQLLWWDGSRWIIASGASAQMEVYEQPDQPASTNVGSVWIDTDETMPVATRPLTYRDLGAV